MHTLWYLCLYHQTHFLLGFRMASMKVQPKAWPMTWELLHISVVPSQGGLIVWNSLPHKFQQPKNYWLSISTSHFSLGSISLIRNMFKGWNLGWIWNCYHGFNFSHCVLLFNAKKQLQYICAQFCHCLRWRLLHLIYR